MLIRMFRCPGDGAVKVETDWGLMRVTAKNDLLLIGVCQPGSRWGDGNIHKFPRNWFSGDDRAFRAETEQVVIEDWSD